MSACSYCNAGDIPVEVLGFMVHRLSDRWISCCNGVSVHKVDTERDSARNEVRSEIPSNPNMP